MPRDYEARRFKAAEMANELAHEDAWEDRRSPKPTQKARHFKEFMALKKKGSNRSHVEDLEFQAFKKRYGWW